MEVTAMLADAAYVGDGKLFIHGAGWDRIYAASFPASHASMAVAVIISVGYDEALTDHQLEVKLLDTEGNLLGAVAGGAFNVGHPAGAVRGAPSQVPLQFTFTGITFPAPGAYEWVVEINGERLARLPLVLATMPAVQRPG